MTITKAQLFDMVCNLKARLDALEGRRVEASDREYMRLFCAATRTAQGQSTVCLTGEESRTAADR